MSALSSRKCDCIDTVLSRVTLFCSLMFLVQGAGMAWASQAGTGELRIEGGSVERLILLDDTGRQRYFDRPGPSVTLAPGVYRLYEVALEGGYVSRSHQASDEREIPIEEGRPAVLTLGAPLRQRVQIERRGSLMVLTYELLGRGGERYAVRGGSEPPTFAVFKGDEQIASDSFSIELGDDYLYPWRPPLGTAGPLRVVPSYDLGSLGAAGGEAAVYSWSWFHSIPGLPLWIALVVVLILSTILSKANRTPWILFILAPVIAIYAGWPALAKILPLGPLEMETLRITVFSVAVGMAVLWLIGRPLTSGAWIRSVLGALSVTAGIVFLGAWSLELHPSEATIRFVCVLSVLMSAATLGYVSAGRACHHHPGLRHFVLSLAVWTIAVSAVAMFVMIATWCSTVGQWLGDTEYILWLTFFVGPVLGACVFALSLLFVIVGFRTRFSPASP